MDQSLTIKVKLKEVENIILDYCKKYFEDYELEFKFDNNECNIELYSKKQKGIFNVERNVKLSKDDVNAIFSLYFRDIGYKIAYNFWINENDENILLFFVKELNLEEKEKQKSIGGK